MNDTIEHKLSPLAPGDLALRFRISYLGANHQRPIVTGVQVCEVLRVDGDFVTWTNHLPARAGDFQNKFSHVAHRCELIALRWLETLPGLPSEKSRGPHNCVAGVAGQGEADRDPLSPKT